MLESWASFLLFFILLSGDLGTSMKADGLSNIRFRKDGQSSEVFDKARIAHRSDVIQRERVTSSDFHEVIISVKKKNMDKVKAILHDVSDPLSQNYGQHWNREQMGEFTSNREATDRVKSYLESFHDDLTISSETPFGDYITIRAPVSILENLFSTRFYYFDHYYNEDGNNRVRTLIRSLTYSIPPQISKDIHGAFNVIDFPLHAIKLKSTSASSKATSSQEDLFLSATSYEPFDGVNNIANITQQSCPTAGCTIPNVVTPGLVNAFHGITNNTGDVRVSQAIFSSQNNSYSVADLNTYFDFFHIPRDKVDTNIGGHVLQAPCFSGSAGSICMEASLDVQILLSTSQVTKTTFFYSPYSFADWLVKVTQMSSPPKILSISYGYPEYAVTLAELNSFNDDAKILGAQGVTIFAAAGDDGVTGMWSGSTNIRSKDGTLYCGYHSVFPASSPYVTAVGATQGPESGDLEVVCQGNVGVGVGITSGGGFSETYPRPSWQESEVRSYFNQRTPFVGYNAGGRAYPDLTGLGRNWIMANAGKMVAVSGTSASCPMVAGMVSLVNAARVRAGKGTVGWLNPAIYYFSRQPDTMYGSSGAIFNDVISGTNNCDASGTNCCNEGFSAAAGWDPASGLGSIIFPTFRDAFVKLGSAKKNVNSSTLIPSGSPWPTSAPSPEPPVISEGGLLYFDIYTRPGCNDSTLAVREVVNTGTCVDTGVGYVHSLCKGSTAYRYVTPDATCSASKNVYENTFGFGCNSAANYMGSSSSVGTRVTCAAPGESMRELPDGEYMVISYFASSLQGCSGTTNQTRIIRLGTCSALSPTLSYKITYDAGTFTQTIYKDDVCSTGASVLQKVQNYACEPHASVDSPFQASLLITKGMSKSYEYVNIFTIKKDILYPKWSVTGLGTPETLGVVIFIIILSTLLCGKPLSLLAFVLSIMLFITQQNSTFYKTI